MKVLDTQAAPLADGVAGDEARWYRGGGLAREDAMIHREVDANDWMTSREATPSSKLKKGLEMRRRVCHQRGTRRASQKKTAIETDTNRSRSSNPVSDCRSSESGESSETELGRRENKVVIASVAVLSKLSGVRGGKMVAEGGEYTLKQTKRQAGMTTNWNTASVCPIQARRVPRVRRRTVDRKR